MPATPSRLVAGEMNEWDGEGCDMQSEQMIRRPMTATGYNSAGATRARLCYWSPVGGGEELPSYLLHIASSIASR